MKNTSIMYVSTEGTWATQVEVIATATVFKVPVYFCTQSRSGDKLKYVQSIVMYNTENLTA